MEFATVSEMIKFFHEHQEKYLDPKAAEQLKEMLYNMAFAEQIRREYAQ